MPSTKTPGKLYSLCVRRVITLLEDFSDVLDTRQKTLLDTVDERLMEDILMEAYVSTCRERKVPFGAAVWRNEWKAFFTPKVRNAIMSWDKDLLRHVGKKCRCLKRILVVRWTAFDHEILKLLPNSVVTLDFDGELFFRGRHNPALDLCAKQTKSWLQDAQETLKALYLSRQKVLPTAECREEGSRLTEVHLGTVYVTSQQVREIISCAPNLRVLRHYQLVTALYELHSEQWKSKERLPSYRLINLDVDFSHVIRCRMSPRAVLSSDALQLAVLLCPDARLIHVRFDCSTPHDVIAPLVNLQRVELLSLVCVSSGERSLLDFSDVIPILQKHGPQHMKSLELKVIEELDVHVITKNCAVLERLVLSGCGNVSPETCAEYSCKPTLRTHLKLRKLRYLFFADGDDFSWDHAVPICFWYATLGSGKRELTAGISCRIEGMFLESPRIPVDVAADVFTLPEQRKKLNSNEDVAVLFPFLRVFSVCRYPELSPDHLKTILGVDEMSRTRKLPLKYVRLSDCEQFNFRHEMWLKNLLTKIDSSNDVVVTIS